MQKWSRGLGKGGEDKTKAVGDFKGLLQCEERTNLEGKNSLGPTRMEPQNPASPCNHLVGTSEAGGTNQLMSEVFVVLSREFSETRFGCN